MAARTRANATEENVSNEEQEDVSKGSGNAAPESANEADAWRLAAVEANAGSIPDAKKILAAGFSLRQEQIDWISSMAAELKIKKSEFVRLMIDRAHTFK